MKYTTQSPIISLLKWIWNTLISAQKVFLILLSILLILGVTIQTVLRQFSSINVSNMDDIIIILAFWLYFLGSSFGTFERSHISAEIASVYIKNVKLNKFVYLLSSIITIILSFLFTIYASQFFIWGIEKGETSPILHIPMVIAQSSIFIGFILMTFYFIANFVIDIKKNNYLGQ